MTDSQVPVNFNLVRYSAIEGVHWFFDPAYPTTIQFLRQGRWEPWDVGYVSRHSDDPDIKRLASDAETDLILEPRPGYTPWPHSPADTLIDSQSNDNGGPSEPRSPTRSHPYTPTGHQPALQDLRYDPYSLPSAPRSTEEIWRRRKHRPPRVHIPAATSGHDSLPSPYPASSAHSLPPPRPVSEYTALNDRNVHPHPPSPSVPTRPGAADGSHPAPPTVHPASSTVNGPPGPPPPFDFTAPTAAHGHGHYPSLPEYNSAGGIPPPPPSTYAPPVVSDGRRPPPVPASTDCTVTTTATGHGPTRAPPAHEPIPGPVIYATEPNAAPPTRPPPRHEPVEYHDRAGFNYPGSPKPSSSVPGSPNAIKLAVRSERTAKILLSLDGDGIRGLSSVLLVESLINAICTKMNRPLACHEIFDLIGGVSTTGLLAIMLGRLRMKVHKAREKYLEIMKAVFCEKWNFFASLDPHGLVPSASGPPLEESVKGLVVSECGGLDEPFFDGREDSANTMVITSKVDIGFNQPAIVRSYQSRRVAGPEIEQELAVWQAIMATLAAPRYVAPQDALTRRAVIEPGLVDYGTAKNNPVRDLYFECRKLYSYTNDTMIIVSIGTGGGRHNPDELKEMAMSVRDRTLDAKMMEEKFEKDNRRLMEEGWIKYFRFNVPNLDHVPLEENLAVDAIMEKTHQYLAGPEVGRRFYAAVDAIVAILSGEKGGWPYTGGSRQVG
ncbi:FabD/lysophospholipase-like protein [Westerdykella ornata]|uniref:FabD/lysophospholipase-like protein n=1 Tax=Westerdykella ornata TaxID=318751 RepID=A0A6A6JAU3_WESOR|nr:FabD/lysophospholipase-like protein [Westerdykella ornata]KAF2272746.1 FabD/lysophospholipase-like protein [Westerdykella ornata]